MKVVKEYWECDICKKQYMQDNKLHKMKIPSKNYDCEGRSWSKSFTELDLCEDCLDMFWELNNKYFATVDNCYSITVTKHFAIAGSAEGGVNNER